MALGSGAMASGLIPGAVAQDEVRLPVSPDDIRGLHRRWLEQAAEELGGTLALTRAGLDQARTSLAELPDLLEGNDDDVLRQTLDVLFNADNLDDLLSRVMVTYEQAVDGLGDVARAIVEIIVSSVEYAQNVLRDIDYDIAKLVIAHDVRAAIDGAALGSELVAWLPGARVAGAVAAAVVAGTAGSIIGYEDAKDRAQMRRDG